MLAPSLQIFQREMLQRNWVCPGAKLIASRQSSLFHPWKQGVRAEAYGLRIIICLLILVLRQSYPFSKAETGIARKVTIPNHAAGYIASKVTFELSCKNPASS
jgi:hypothetical protein